MKQNINYIGSKYSLLDFIYEKISLVGDLKEKTFCDLFAGSNIVGVYFKDKVKCVISNDIEYYSYVLANKYLSVPSCGIEFIDTLNSLNGVAGDVFNYFSDNGSSGRKYFSEQNGMKIDAIRQKIEEWLILGVIDIDCYYYFLASLIESADKVANTTSVYGSYLKSVKKTAQKNLILNTMSVDDSYCSVCYNQDSNKLIKNIKGDILYIDPPYNHRQYGSNYHILNAIAKYDFSSEPRGITGLLDYNKSDYCYVTKVGDTFDDLIKNANFSDIFISYNNEGILTKDEFVKILEKYGELIVYEKDYKTYKSDSKRKNKSDSVVEYLFYLKKRKS